MKTHLDRGIYGLDHKNGYKNEEVMMMNSTRTRKQCSIDLQFFLLLFGFFFIFISRYFSVIHVLFMELLLLIL